MIEYVQSQLTSKNEYQRYVGIGLFFGSSLAISASVFILEKTIFFFVGVAIVIHGLYELYTSRFYDIIRAGGLITLGIGIQLVALEVVQLWQLILLWPLAFMIFGTITLLSAIFADRHHQVG